MKPGTLWFRLNEKGEYEYNHLEDGHCPNPTPTPQHEAHKWSGKWKSEYIYLTDTIPAKVVKNHDVIRDT